MFLFRDRQGRMHLRLDSGSGADLALGRNDAAGNLHMRVTISQ
jgi:hypothetical protein